MAHLSSGNGGVKFFDVPRNCPECGARGVVTLETIVSGDVTSRHWQCSHCYHEWPAVPTRAKAFDVRPTSK